MKIERIDTYSDPRFPQKLLYQHNCFLADGEPCAFEIISGHEAIIHCEDASKLPLLIDEFRFFACHITVFYDKSRKLVSQLSPVRSFPVSIKDIQPSQFYIDRDKLDAVKQFIFTADDIIVPVLRYGERFISLDGHTRLYLAALNGWETVNAVEDVSDSYIYGFVSEAERRKILTASDMELVDHGTYEIKWNQFCDDFFANNRN